MHPTSAKFRRPSLITGRSHRYGRPSKAHKISGKSPLRGIAKSQSTNSLFAKIQTPMQRFRKSPGGGCARRKLETPSARKLKIKFRGSENLRKISRGGGAQQGKSNFSVHEISNSNSVFPEISKSRSRVGSQSRISS